MLILLHHVTQKTELMKMGMI